MMQNYPPIFFATVNLNKQVHAQALGFTYQFYKYVCAASPVEASLLVHAWASAKGLDVKNVEANTLAWNQDVSTFTFPEQILNLPSEVLEEEYNRRDYPESYRSPGQYVSMEACHG